MALGDAFAGEALADAPHDYATLQREIDEVTPDDFADYLQGGCNGFCGLFKPPVFSRLDDAFDRVVRELRACEVVEKPAVWLLYNMGIVVKTRESVFSVDLMHRKATELAPALDFALITHNHRDHFTEDFYRVMNGAGRTVISNFKDNYGVKDRAKDGGYTRQNKVFRIKDVEIRTSLTDHNPYLIDFTSVFEIRVGNFVIYHSGDCSNAAKLNPTARPDLWFVHPYNWMDVKDCVNRVKPVRTVIAHLNELSHATGRARWTWEQGLKAQAAVREAGYEAIVPTWGERVL